MREIIFKAPDADYLASEAARLGFLQENPDGTSSIITNGSFQSGGGFFLNIVGTVYEPVTPPAAPEDPWPAPVPREGYWGRLRLNGEPEAMVVFSDQIIQFVWSGELEGWTTDGKTIAPWVGAIGVIA